MTPPPTSPVNVNFRDLDFDNCLSTTTTSRVFKLYDRYAVKAFLRDDPEAIEREVGLLKDAGPELAPVPLGHLFRGDSRTVVGYVMPLYENISIHTSTETKLKYMDKMFATVSKLHAKGIIHGDLALDQFLITPKGDFILCDFGRAVHVSDTMKPMLAWRDGYVSPRRLESSLEEPLREWDDLYALGVVVYEMFVGRLPLWGVAQDDVVDLIRDGLRINVDAVEDSKAKEFITKCFEAGEVVGFLPPTRLPGR